MRNNISTKGNKILLLVISFSLLLLPLALMQPSPHKVTLMLDFNINGIENDNAEVDGHGPGIYYPDDLQYYYVCLEDNSAAFGIAAAGSLNYINLSKPNNYTMQLSQNSGSFILPITKGSCNSIKNKMPVIETLPFTPYASFIKRPNNVTYIILNYSLDLVGDFSKQNDFILTMEKNNSQIIFGGR